MILNPCTGEALWGQSNLAKSIIEFAYRKEDPQVSHIRSGCRRARSGARKRSCFCRWGPAPPQDFMIIIHVFVDCMISFGRSECEGGVMGEGVH